MDDLMNDLKNKMEEETKQTFIHADHEKVEVQGYPAALLSDLAQIIMSLKKCPGIEREDIEKAVRLAYMDDLELTRECLEKMKEMLEKLGSKKENE